MSKTLKVACFDRSTKDIDTIINLLNNSHADLILFPEMFFNTGEGKNHAFWTQQAKALQKCIVIGLSTQDHIAQIAYLPGGESVQYNKIHLGTKESKIFKSGQKIQVFEYKGFTIGIQICSDTHFNEMSIIQRKMGADLILAPFKSPHSIEKRERLWRKYLNTRAYDYRFSIVANNYSSENFGGHIGFDFNGELMTFEMQSLPIYTINKFKSKNTMKTIDFFNKRKEKIYRDYL